MATVRYWPTATGTGIGFSNTSITNTTFTSSTADYIVTTPVRKQPHYWFKINRRECQLCGKVYETREKMTTPRPENRDDRVVHEVFYDYCG
jgi:hypothetical protein